MVFIKAYKIFLVTLLSKQAENIITKTINLHQEEIDGVLYLVDWMAINRVGFTPYTSHLCIALCSALIRQSHCVAYWEFIRKLTTEKMNISLRVIVESI